MAERRPVVTVNSCFSGREGAGGSGLADGFLRTFGAFGLCEGAAFFLPEKLAGFAFFATTFSPAAFFIFGFFLAIDRLSEKQSQSLSGASSRS